MVLPRHIAQPGAKSGSTSGPFLARNFFALHEVKHRHEQTRDIGITRTVRGLEHHREAGGNQAHKGGGALIHRQGLRMNALAQGGERVQTLKQIGNGTEEPRAVPARQAQALRLQRGPHRGHAAVHGLSLVRQRASALRRGTRQIQVRQAAFFLQLMHQPGDMLDQGAGIAQLREFGHFGLPRGNQVSQRRFHGVGSQGRCRGATVHAMSVPERRGESGS